MNRAWVALAAGLILMLGQGVARADLFSVSADLPLALDLKFDSDSIGNSVAGYKVGVSLPFLVGFGFESYKAALDKKDFVGKGDLNFQIVDIFLNLPIPVLNIAIGAGVGSATFDPSKFDLGGGSSLKIDSAPVTQYFFSVGLPIAVIFDVHLGYHVLSGKIDSKVSGGGSSGSDSADLSATMTSLGVKVGF